MAGVVEFVFDLRRVVTAEVHSLAHLGNRVGQRLACLTNRQAHQRRHLFFHQVGHPFQAGGALGHRRGGPIGSTLLCQVQRALHVRRACLDHAANQIVVVGRIAHRLHFAVGDVAVAQHREGAPLLLLGRLQAQLQGGQHVLAGQIQALGVFALLPIQLQRRRNFLVRLAAVTRGLGHRVRHQFVYGYRLVHDAVDEGTVGAVFQQTAHQVGQQGFMRPHRRVDAAGLAQLVLAHHLVIQGFTHAVQALEFVILAGCQVKHRGQAISVVRGELRIDRILRRQQLLGACEVGHVGVDLAGIDRVARQAVHLSAFDLRVPVSAFNQTHHETVIGATRQIDQEIDHIGTALLIGLHYNADALKAVQIRIVGQRLHQIHGDFQAVGFFCIDVQTDIVLLGQQEQALQTRQQLGHHPFVLDATVARVDSGQLHRNAGAVVNPAAG